MKSRPDNHQDERQDKPENKHVMTTRAKNGITTTSKRLYSVFIQSQLEMETKKVEALPKTKKARTGDVKDEKPPVRIRKTTTKQKRETTITEEIVTANPLSRSTTNLHFDYEPPSESSTGSFNFRLDTPYLSSPYIETHALTPPSFPMTPGTPLHFTPGSPLSSIGSHLEYRNEIVTPDAIISMNTTIDVTSPKRDEEAPSLNIFGEPFEPVIDETGFDLGFEFYASEIANFGLYSTPSYKEYCATNEEVEEWIKSLK